jgi:hypothetical protein
MTQSSPADLAVTFRSIARRLRQALGDVPESAVAAQTAEIHGHIHAAASLLHTSPDAEAVAAAISDRPADDWEISDLDALRANALEIGGLLRAIEAKAGADDR